MMKRTISDFLTDEGSSAPRMSLGLYVGYGSEDRFGNRSNPGGPNFLSVNAELILDVDKQCSARSRLSCNKRKLPP